MGHLVHAMTSVTVALMIITTTITEPEIVKSSIALKSLMTLKSLRIMINNGQLEIFIG